MMLAVSACDTSNEDPLPPLTPAIQEGDMWIMNREVRVGPNFPDPPLTETSRLDTFVVDRVRLFNDRSWFRIESKESGYGLISLITVSEHYYSFREDGIWQLDENDQEIHFVRYPNEEAAEYNVVEGVYSQLVNPDTLYTLPNLGTVAAVKFQNRYTTEFLPFASEDESYEYRLLPLGQEVTTATYFSAELGPIRRESFFVTIQDAPESARYVGTQTWELVAYVPVNAQ